MFGRCTEVAVQKLDAIAASGKVQSASCVTCPVNAWRSLSHDMCIACYSVQVPYGMATRHCIQLDAIAAADRALSVIGQHVLLAIQCEFVASSCCSCL